MLIDPARRPARAKAEIEADAVLPRGMGVLDFEL